VTDREVGARVVFDGDFEGVGARRVEKAVAHHRADRAGRDHRLGDETVDRTEQRGLVDGLARDDGECRVEGKMTDEHGEPAQHHAFELGQQPVANKRKIALPVDPVIDAEVDIVLAEGGLSLRARFNVSLPSVARDVAERLVHEAHKNCPYSKATRGNIDVAVTLA
jgi:hypothetical protein